MKILFHFLLGICLLFQWSAVQAVQYSFGEGGAKLILTYQMDHYLHLSMLNIRKSMEAAFGRPFHEISFKDVFKKAKEGDKDCQLFVTYLYLDKLLAESYPKLYPSHLKEIELTNEDIKDIQSSWNMSSSYEWDFISGWHTFFLLQSGTPNRFLFLKKSFYHFLIAKKDKSYQEFQLPWAFLVVTMEDHANFDEFSIREAKKAVLSLAKNGYAPAQHLMGFVELRNNRISSALKWFQQSFENGFRKDFCLIAMGKACVDLKRFSEAIPYLKAAIYEYHYEFLKPELMNAYIQEDEISLASDVAKEIAENYTKFPLDVSLSSMQFLSFVLFAGQETREHLLESYTWLTRVHQIAKEKNVSIDFEYDHAEALKSTLSMSEQIEAERRSRNLHRPAKMYSQMDTRLNTCEEVYH